MSVYSPLDRRTDGRTDERVIVIVCLHRRRRRLLRSHVCVYDTCVSHTRVESVRPTSFFCVSQKQRQVDFKFYNANTTTSELLLGRSFGRSIGCVVLQGKGGETSRNRGERRRLVVCCDSPHSLFGGRGISARGRTGRTRRVK